MKCSKCGTEVAEGTKFCPYCGADMTAAPAETQPVYASDAAQTVYNPNGTVASAPQDTQKNNGFAVAGLVIGLISFCCCSLCGIGPVLGLIFSILGLKSEKRSLAIAGLVLSILSIVLMIITSVLYAIGSLPFVEEYMEEFMRML